MSKNASKNVQAISQRATNDPTSSPPSKKHSKASVATRDDAEPKKSNNSRDGHSIIELEESTQHIYKLALDSRLFVAPVSRLERVLDVGSGYGIWATEMAQANPTAEVNAFDILPVPSAPHPSNVTFKTHDCSESWPYPKDYFDLIHIRGLFGSIQDWPALYQRVLKHLRPGGFVEHLEWSLHIRSAEGKISSNPMFSQWSQNVISAGALSGKTYEIAENMAGLIDEAGFKDVVEQGYWWPIGAWSGDMKIQELGRRNLVHWERKLKARSLSLFRESPDMTQSELKEWILSFISLLKNPGHEIYHEMRVVHARKPS